MSVIEKPVSTVDAAVVSHYHLVAPIMEQLFGAIPLVWAAYPFGSEKPPQFHVHYYGHWTRLSAEHIERLAAIGALEFYSWTPTADDARRARFARFLLQQPSSNAASVRKAAPLLRDVLAEEGFGAIPVLDGAGGVALFVPVAGAPLYDDLRAWCHTIAQKAIAQHPDLFSQSPNTAADGRVHIHVTSNAVDLFSILPYSLRAVTGRIATPVSWNEFETCDIAGAPVHDFPARLTTTGEVFSRQLSAITPRAIPNAHALAMAPGASPAGHNSRSAVVNAAIEILSDGKTRSAEEILAIAREWGLLSGTNAKNIFSELNAYVHRTLGRGRKPSIVKTVDHKFRINEPPDAWPDAPAAKPARPAIDVDRLIARLHTTAKDSANSAEFEVAVCDALAALGFLTTHVGGHAAPDGYADAPLGTMGYRVMLECKSGSVMEHSPNLYEAAKYKDPYHAQYCALIGSESGASQDEVMSEAQTHGVSLWGIDDLAFALENRLSLLEIEHAFGPGIAASDVLPDILWARNHGQSKRVRIIADIIHTAGWVTQCAATQGGSPADAPLLTEDAAMLLVDQELAAQGAHVNCARAEVRLALRWLTSPLVGAAVWNAETTAITITAP